MPSTRANVTATVGGNSFFAGKNKIINGDFGIWQRGTSFTNVAVGAYTADRWIVSNAESTGTNVSRSTFTPATAPVVGYEGQYFLTFVKGGTTSDKMGLAQRIEDVRTFAGQTVTISYWMKGSANFTNEPLVQQNFGSGGSSEVYTTTATQSITTSWARYSVTVSVPSISGKTVGTSSFIGFWPLRYTGTSNITADIWGVQIEAGSVATPFETATGTIQGELAACQRYYVRFSSTNNTNGGIAGSFTWNGVSTSSYCNIPLPVTMRVAPTAVDFSNLRLLDPGVNNYNITAVTLLGEASPNNGGLALTTTGLATGKTYYLYNQGSVNGYLGFSAEL